MATPKVRQETDVSTDVTTSYAGKTLERKAGLFWLAVSVEEAQVPEVRPVLQAIR